MGARAWKVEIYPRLMIIYVVSAFVAIAITSLIMTIYVRQTAIRSMSASVQTSIQRTSQILDVMADSVKTFALQLYFDRDISKLRNLESPDVFDLSTATYRLSTFGAVLPYLESIYIYSDIGGSYYVSTPYGPTRVYPSARFFDGEVAKILHDTEHYSVLYPISREIPLIGSSGETSRAKGLTFVFYGPSEQNTATEGAVVLNMSQTWVQRLIADAEASDGGKTLIVDQSGQIAIDDIGNVFASELSHSTLLKRILARNRPVGFLVNTVAGRRYLLAYAEYEPFKWVMVRAIPLAGVMSRVNVTVLNAILICAALLLSGLVASMIMSRRFLTPVRRLIARVHEMQDEIRVTRDARKIEYLKGLIGLTDDPYIIEGAPDDVGLAIPIRNDRAYFLIYLIIDRFDHFSARYNARERERIKRRIIEVATAALAPTFRSEGVALDDERIVIFVDDGSFVADDPFVAESCSPDGEGAPAVAHNLSTAQNNLAAALDLSVTFVVSRRGTGVDSLPLLYEQVRAASPNRFFHGPASIVDCNDPAEVGRKEFSDYTYPTGQERAFIKYLLSGEFDHARRTLDKLISSCLTYSFGTFRLVLARIISVTNSSLAEVERMRDTSFGRDLDKLIMGVDKLESYSEVRDYFATYLDTLASEMSTSTQEKYQQLLNRISGIVSGEYANRNLSLQYVADKVGMSPQYLGRLYHQLRGRSMVTEINEVRIEKAKNMLEASQRSIDQIVYASGFSNSQHFFRVFRQRTGMTPRAYRETSLWKPA